MKRRFLPFGHVKPLGWLAAQMTAEWENLLGSQGNQLTPDPWLGHALLVGGGKGKMLARSWANKTLASFDGKDDLGISPSLARALLDYGAATGDPRALDAVAGAVKQALQSPAWTEAFVDPAESSVLIDVLETLGDRTGDATYHDAASAWFERCFPSSGTALDEESEGEASALLLGRTGEVRWADRLEAWTAHGRAPLLLLRSQVLADPEGLRLALFQPATIKTDVRGVPLTIEVDTRDPQDLNVELRIYPDATLDASFFIRIPGWAHGCLITGDGMSGLPEPIEGWLEIRRRWNRGDAVTLTFDR